MNGKRTESERDKTQAEQKQKSQSLHKMKLEGRVENEKENVMERHCESEGNYWYRKKQGQKMLNKQNFHFL